MRFNACLVAGSSAISATVLASPLAPLAKTVAVPLKQMVDVPHPKALVTAGQSKLRHVNGVTTEGNVLLSNVGALSLLASYVAIVQIGNGTRALVIDTGCETTHRIVTTLSILTPRSFQYLVRREFSLRAEVNEMSEKRPRR